MPKTVTSTHLASNAVQEPTNRVTAEEKAMLLALPTEFDAPVREAIPRMTEHVTRLLGSARLYEEELVARTEFTSLQLQQLNAWNFLLERIEAGRNMDESPELPPGLRRGSSSRVASARKNAEEIKREAIDLFAYFGRKEPLVLALLKHVRPGRGDVDLLDDLAKLALLVETFLDQMPLRERFGAAPVATVLAARQGLVVALAERACDEERALFRKLRTRCYWLVKRELEELVAAAHYAFRDRPKIAKLFTKLAAERKRAQRIKRASSPQAH